MPKSITEEFGLDKNAFALTGAFDALVGWDTLLFVDPHLLTDNSIPEFADAHDELLSFFRDTLKLVSRSKTPKDIPWRAAVKRLTLKEMGAFGLGYAKGHSSGSGIGAEFAEQLARTMKEIFDLGVDDPEMFELLPVFEEGVGPDRISDMVCRILIGRFASFTERVFRESGHQGKSISWTLGESRFKIPAHPAAKNSPVLLCPRELLRDLPVAEGFDLGAVFGFNEELRSRLNLKLGADWRKFLNDAKKPERRRVFTEDPELLKAVLKAYKETPPVRYDFERDPAGEVFWRKEAKEVAHRFPLQLQLSENPDNNEIALVVRRICDHFGHLVEKNGLWEVLTDDKKRSRKERITQRLFFGVADSYCTSNDLDISPESNAGQGPVDFKFSRGRLAKVIVELKHSSNSKLVDGYTEQVEAYRQSENAVHAIYLVLIIGDHDKKIESLVKQKNALSDNGQPVAELVFVDSRPKESASKRSRIRK